MIPSVLSIISPVLTANIISSITVYDFDMATKYLSYDFAIIIVSAVSYFCYHLVSTKVNKTLITNLQNYVYSNVQNNKNINSISLSILNDIYSSTNFNKNLLYKACFLIKSIVILIIIIKYNLFIALVIIAVSVVSFLLLKLTDKKIQKSNLALSGFQNDSLELFNSIHRGAETEQNQNASKLLKDKYFNLVDKAIKTTNKISLLYNINNNFITLILKTTIFAATLFLISEIKTTALTLSLYLILTPYLTSSAQNLISFFDLFSEFGTIENALLNFDSLKYQSALAETEKLELSKFNLSFFNVSTNSDDDGTDLSNINLNIEENSFALFVGEFDSGKETLFNLLKRKTKISSGSIFIGNKNIDSISNENYSSLISFTSKDPYFYNISIMENMYLVCRSKSKITKLFSDWNLTLEINKLKNKIDTVVTEKTNKNLCFFLGLAKCYLLNAKIICVYDTPTDLTSHENDLFFNIIKKIIKDRILIIISSTEKLSHLANNVFYIEKGKIKNNQKSK